MPRRRGKRLITVGSVLLAIGIIVGIIGGVVGFNNSLAKVNSFQRVPVGATGQTVTFAHTGDYVAYFESGSVSRNQSRLLLVPMELVSPSGQTVSKQPYGGGSNDKIKRLYYDYRGHKGLAMYQFHIGETGAYRVSSAAPPGTPSDAVIAFGPSISTGLVAGGVLIVVGILVFVAGLVLLIIGLVRFNRKPPAAYGYGYPPPGYPPAAHGAPPGYGYPTPGAPQYPPPDQYQYPPGQYQYPPASQNPYPAPDRPAEAHPTADPDAPRDER